MKNLFNYINESVFKGSAFYNHNYAKDVIAQICNTGTIRLGKDGDTTFTIPDDIHEKVKKAFSDKENEMSLEMFNRIMNTFGLPVWTKIFKGDFSGYKNGPSSKNRGNMFEDNFIANFSKQHAQELEKALKLKPGTFENCIPKKEGDKNQPRPLTKDGKDIVVGGFHKTVGESVVDVFVKDVDGNPYNLSLKWGSTATFINAGVSRIFTKRSFEQYDVTGKYTAETFNGVDGNQLLDLFAIDHDQFGNIWSKDQQPGKRVDVTSQLKNSKEFMKFVESTVGYNYVLVHQIGNKIHYIDLRTEQDMKKLLGTIKKAEVCYRGLGGKGTRIDILVEMPNITLKYNIRDKQSTPGHYPSHIMCDYTIHHY